MLNKGHLANFAQNRLPWQRSWRNKKEVRVEKIHANAFHLVKRSWKSVQYILR